MSAHFPRFPAPHHGPLPWIATDARTETDDLCALIEIEADRAYGMTRRAEDYTHPEGRANLRRYLLALQAANREIGA